MSDGFSSRAATMSCEVGDNLIKHLDGAGLDCIHTGTGLGLLPRTGLDGLGLALISRGGCVIAHLQDDILVP